MDVQGEEEQVYLEDNGLYRVACSTRTVFSGWYKIKD